MNKKYLKCWKYQNNSNFKETQQNRDKNIYYLKIDLKIWCKCLPREKSINSFFVLLNIQHFEWYINILWYKKKEFEIK